MDELLYPLCREIDITLSNKSVTFWIPQYKRASFPGIISIKEIQNICIIKIYTIYILFLQLYVYIPYILPDYNMLDKLLLLLIEDHQMQIP